MPGGTPYVRSQSDLERFLDKCRRYFNFFMKQLNGVTMTPIEIRDLLANGAAPNR
jgi:coproporphyrinogen III oxidase-like Fe-S oxidoreductase